MCTWKREFDIKYKTDCRSWQCSNSDSYIPPADRTPEQKAADNNK